MWWYVVDLQKNKKEMKEVKQKPVQQNKLNIQLTIRYSNDLEKFYMVELDESLDFPAMVYYFCHIGEDEGGDLA